jgi:two-component system chemotaxis response regulator CheY
MSRSPEVGNRYGAQVVHADLGRAGRRLMEGMMAIDLSMPILVVDDYNTMIRIICNLLKQLGYQNIDNATDGATALAKLRAGRYGLVISDWNMEPMSGYDLLREVRADEKLGKTPFIMITAESKTENVIAAKRAGVSNYIVKPFNAQTLQHKIAAVFGEDPTPPLAA